jgi:phosphoribosylanthranilate isomerase
MFRVKICGITNEADARFAIDVGADAIGFNFYAKSKRFVEPAAAREIADALPNNVQEIGVFVNHTAAEICSIATTVGLNGIQLHGDERPEFFAELPAKLLLIRAFRCGASGLAPLSEYLEKCRTAGRVPDVVLIDADAGAEFGGTGQRADWGRVAKERGLLEDMPLILAGGLTPANVAAAIATVHPDGVDVASGVERAPGRKDDQLVADFVAAAKRAFGDAQPRVPA